MNTTDLIFTWIPFKGIEESALKQNIPETISQSKLENLLKEESPPFNPFVAQEMGCYVAIHKVENPDIFSVISTSSLMPLVFNQKVFNESFHLQKELTSIPNSDFAALEKQVQTKIVAEKFGV